MADHERGERKAQFCAIPAKPKCPDCPGSKDYRAVCEPGWSSHTFQRLVRAKAGTTSFAKVYEAHHIVCVAPVTDELVSKQEIEGVLAQTVWCINKKSNMLAMPLWGHTVMHYCNVVATTFDTSAPPPAFANIPQHDCDHNSEGRYTWEVMERCKALAMKVERAGHKLKGSDLAGALDAMSTDFEALLTARGLRCGGTHAAWQMGIADPMSAWCYPFSMASDGWVTKKAFPVRRFDALMAKWMKRIAEAIAGV